MRRSIALAALILLVLPCFVVGVSAVENGAAVPVEPDYQVPVNGVLPELKIELNCTWSPWPDHLIWFDSWIMPPLPRTGWAGEIVSVEVPDEMVVHLYVTDAFQRGDHFEAWMVDGLSPTEGTLVGVTPTVPVDPTLGTGDPDVAFADPTFRHAVFSL